MKLNYNKLGFIDPFNSTPEQVDTWLNATKTFSDLRANTPTYNPRLPGNAGPYTQGLQRSITNLTNPRFQNYQQRMGDWQTQVQQANQTNNLKPWLRNQKPVGVSTGFGVNGMKREPQMSYAHAYRMPALLDQINPDWSQIPFEQKQQAIYDQARKVWQSTQPGFLSGLVSPFSVLSAGLGFAGAPLAARIAAGGAGAASS